MRLIFEPSDHDRPEILAARRLYLVQGDAVGALQALPRHCSAERAILEVSWRGVHDRRCGMHGHAPAAMKSDCQMVVS